MIFVEWEVGSWHAWGQGTILKRPCRVEEVWWKPLKTLYMIRLLASHTGELEELRLKNMIYCMIFRDPVTGRWKVGDERRACISEQYLEVKS